MYLVVIEAVVSAVICFFRNGKVLSAYYLSHVLVGTEIRYSLLEKHIFCLFVSAWKLNLTFKHTRNYVDKRALRQVMHKPDFTGRMIKWYLS